MSKNYKEIAEERYAALIDNDMDQLNLISPVLSKGGDTYMQSVTP